MQVIELPREDFTGVETLFRSFEFDRAFLDSVFEGRQEARVFVDSVAAPRAALMCRTYGYYVAGESAATSLSRFVEDAPAEVGVFQDLYGYFPPNEGWEARLTHARSLECLEGIDREAFRFPEEHTAQTTAHPKPYGVRLVPIDRALAARIDREARELIGFFWGGYERFERYGFGVCALIGDAIASIAYAPAVSEHEATLNVETAAAFRRMGLATLVSRTFVDEARSRGVGATWVCDAANEASIKTAQRVGFRKTGSFRMIMRRPGFCPSSGSWRRVDEDARPVTWTRSTVCQ